MQLADYDEHQVAGHTDGSVIWDSRDDGWTGKQKNIVLGMIKWAE